MSNKYEVSDYINVLRTLSVVPEGYCKCGCGERTRIATRNDTHQKLVKGRPVASIAGHQNKKNPYGYVLDNIEIDPTSLCWNWTGATFQINGRPRWLIGWYGPRKTVTAYRAVFELLVDRIPEGLHICHSCDNPSCVNPEHLWIGSAKDNLQDASTKGRLHTGQENRIRQRANLKLNEEKVRFIRQSDLSLTALAEKFNVSRTLISLVKKREVWSDVQ